MENLQEKIAIVTGASYGIGRAVAIGLAREGCKVILVARGEEGLRETLKRIEDEGHQADIHITDISKLDSINSLVSFVNNKYGKVDILWNGAFGWLSGKIEELSEEDTANFIDTSVRGPILVTQQLMPFLLKSKSPHIINVAADWEFPEGMEISAFIAAKRALAGFGIALQKEKHSQIKVTNLHPADVASVDYDVDESVDSLLERTDSKMIPLKELVELVIFILKLKGTIVHQIDIKPIDQSIGTTFL